MNIIAKCTNIKWDFDDVEGKPPKLPTTVELKVKLNDSTMESEFDFEEILSDKFGFSVEDFKVSYEPEITHAAALKFLKAEAAKILEKAIVEHKKFDADIEKHKLDKDPTKFRAIQMDHLKWLDKNVNAKGYVLNFNSTTGEPISISTQNLAFT